MSANEWDYKWEKGEGTAYIFTNAQFIVVIHCRRYCLITANNFC